jgi:methylated-DNA-protein-cysteine methyltransferase-like protein
MTCTCKNFFDQVYEVVKLIPYGRVTTYGAIARFLGTSMSARMVGYALNASHGLRDIPAHRVVNRKGFLTGKHHFVTPNRMEELLRAEGISVQNDKIVNFEHIFWDPFELID